MPLTPPASSPAAKPDSERTRRRRPQQPAEEEDEDEAEEVKLGTYVDTVGTGDASVWVKVVEEDNVSCCELVSVCLASSRRRN